MYTTHHFMVIHLLVKHSMTMWQDKKLWPEHNVINPMNFTLRSKVNIVSGSQMCTSHHLMVIHPCVKYGKPFLNQKKSYGPDTKTCQKPYKKKESAQTDRRKDRQTSEQPKGSYIPP